MILDYDYYIYEQLKVCLELLNKLLKDYVGFFGLDFIITDQETVFVLEMNVRLTAVTIPTLLFNKASGNEALYKEDIKLSDISESDLILTQGAKDTGDVLSFKSNQGVLGKYQYIDLKFNEN